MKLWFSGDVAPCRGWAGLPTHPIWGHGPLAPRDQACDGCKRSARRAWDLSLRYVPTRSRSTFAMRR